MRFAQCCGVARVAWAPTKTIPGICAFNCIIKCTNPSQNTRAIANTKSLAPSRVEHIGIPRGWFSDNIACPPGCDFSLGMPILHSFRSYRIAEAGRCAIVILQCKYFWQRVYIFLYRNGNILGLERFTFSDENISNFGPERYTF